MKKTLSAVLLIAMLLGLVSACGTTEPNFSETTTEATTEKTTEHTTSETTVTTTEGATTSETTAVTSLLPPPAKTYSQEELDEIIEREIDLAITANYLIPPEGYPENYPTPYASGIYAKKYNVTADAYCIFGEDDSEIFVIYRYAGYGPYFATEICYHGSIGGVEPWDRIGYTAGEKAVDIFAIDRKHFIVLWDMFKNGYCITVFEDGISPSEKYTYAPMYDGDMGELSFLFPAEEFEGAGEGLTDDGYVFFQSVTAFYFEEIDEGSCRIVLEYEKDGVSHRRTAIYDINGIRPE